MGPVGPSEALVASTASLNLAGTYRFQTVGDSTALDDATAVSWFARFRFNALPTHPTAATLFVLRPTATADWTLICQAKIQDGSLIILLYHYANDGASEVLNLIFSQGIPFEAGMTVPWSFRGRDLAGTWTNRMKTNNTYTAGSPDVPWMADGPNWGRFPSLGYILEIGDEGGSGADFCIDDFTCWKDHYLTDEEDENLHLGISEPGDIEAANQVISIPFEGTIGATATVADPGLANGGGHADAADFAIGTALGTGTHAYDDPAVTPETLALTWIVPHGGNSLVVSLGSLVEGGTFAALGTDIAPYAATLPFMPQVSVNGGSYIDLTEYEYFKIGGPTWVYFPLTSPGPLLGAVAGGDVVRVNFAKGGLRGRVNGQVAINPAFAAEVIDNRAGDPDSICSALPTTRTLKVGWNFHPYKRILANWYYEASLAWQGTATLDANKEPADFPGTVKLPLTLETPKPPGWAWQCEESESHPEKVYNLPLGPMGTWTIEGFGLSPADTIINEGVQDPGSFSAYTGLPVTWHGVTNIDYSAGTGTGGRDVITFDVALLGETTQGFACLGSVGGDDLIRPSMSPWSGLSLVCSGGGPRTGLIVTVPGNAGRAYDKNTQEIAEVVRPYVVRMLHHLFDVNFVSAPDYHNLRRQDQPTRQFDSYPFYNETYTRAVSSISNYSGGGFSAGLIPDTHKGIIVEITCTAPHGYTEGCEVHVDGGVATLAIDDNGASGEPDDTWTASGMPWNGIRFTVRPHPSDDTKLIAAINWNSGLHANVALSATVSSGLGNLKIPYQQNRVNIQESLGYIKAVDSIAWVNVPVGFDAAAIRDFADLCAANWEAGRKFVVEWANEIWNFIFIAWSYSYSLQYSLPGSGATFAATVAGGAVSGASITAGGTGYFFGEDGWYQLAVAGSGTGAVIRGHVVGGIFTSVEVVAGGTGYVTPPTVTTPPNNRLTDIPMGGQPAIAAIMMRRVRRIFREAWTAADLDPADVLGALSGQGENSTYMNNMVDYCVAAGWTPDIVCPAIYDTASGVSNAGPYSFRDGTLYRSLSKAQTADILEAQIAYSGWATPIALVRAHMDSVGFAAVPLWSYEGGFQNLLSGNMQDTYGVPNPGGYTPEIRDRLGEDYTKQTTLLYDPRMRRLQWAWLKQYQDAGLAVHAEFELGGDGHGDGQGGAQCWDKLVGNVMMPGRGDGTDGLFDNRNAPLSYHKLVSPAYGAFADWNGGALDPDVVYTDPGSHGRRGLPSRAYAVGPR